MAKDFKVKITESLVMIVDIEADSREEGNVSV